MAVVGMEFFQFAGEDAGIGGREDIGSKITAWPVVAVSTAARKSLLPMERIYSAYKWFCLFAAAIRYRDF